MALAHALRLREEKDSKYEFPVTCLLGYVEGKVLFLSFPTKEDNLQI